MATVHTASIGPTFHDDPGSFLAPESGYTPSSASVVDEQVGGVGPDEYGNEGFVRPHILLPDDEDYNEDHPTGFRRANEADLAERAGNPPDSMGFPLSVCVFKGQVANFYLQPPSSYPLAVTRNSILASLASGATMSSTSRGRPVPISRCRWT